ncbi:MAG: hypothetical protein JWN49_207 [Parcubacteria group bacterium]|nr:hypothetical protein [Parcubacteria group bacterium]
MWFFKSKKRSSVVVIDIGSSSVAGAYVHYTDKELPIIYYTIRMPIVPGEGEDIQTAMLRTLTAMGTELIEKGAPALRRETGSGSVDSVLVSVSAPWQETKVRTQAIHPDKPFTFTSRMLSEVVSSSANLEAGRVSTGESVIATILNGYEIPNPIGKRATRAEVVILSSTLEASVIDEIRTRVRKWYHTHEITFVAFAPATYTVLRDLYPHEKDFLILDVSGEGTDLAFVKAGLLVDVGTLPKGIHQLLDATRGAERMTIDEESGNARVPSEQPGYISPDRNARFVIRTEAVKKEWLTGLTDLFKQFAQNHALPRTLFLLADPNARDYLRRSLDTDALHSLWLSDEPLSLISVLPEQFAPYVQARGNAEGDIFLAILTLYQAKQNGL